MFDSLFPVAFCWGTPVIAAAGIFCLAKCGGKDCKHLALTAAVFLACLVLLLGGSALLGHFGLAWRNLPGAMLCLGLLISGLLGVVLTLGCFLPMEMPDLAPVLRWVMKTALLLSAAVVLFYAITFGPIFTALAFEGDERVVTYEGQRLLESEDNWLDTVYEYYEYHGPLVRGNQRLYHSMEAPLVK